MPFKSKKQKKTIDAAAHNPEFAKKVGIKVSDAKKMSAHGKGQTKFEEAKDTVEKDEKGNVKSWKHEGDWEKAKNKEGRGKVTNLSDKARRKTEKMTKAETEMAEAFEKAIEGSIRGGVWTSQPPDKGQKDVPPPQEVDGGILNKKQPKPVNAPRPVKKAEVTTDVEEPTVAEGKGKQSYSGGDGKKITKSEHEANKKQKKEKEKFKKMAEAFVQIGRLEQMIMEAKKAKKDYDGDGKVETEKDEVWGSRMKAAKKSGKMEEGSKPDYIDLDKDGDKKEPMKKAAKDAKKGKAVEEGKDEGEPGKNFAKIAKDAGERYGSKEKGEKVAGAVRAKLAKQGKLEEANKEKEPEGLYSKKRFETDSQRLARLAKEKRQAEKKKAAEKVDEGKAKCTCEDHGKSKCEVHGKKKDKYMESLFAKLDNQLNG